MTEQALVFPCAGESLLGIISCPSPSQNTGVLIVVGGPQYRVGSHRQFRLLSTSLSNAGYPSMRFDYRGMGDSGGDLRDFENVDQDIGSAIDVFLANNREIDRVVLWGLCDAASAILLYWEKIRDCRVAGLCLLNPWVRSDAMLARTQLKHYYVQRLLDKQFWIKFINGELNIISSLSDIGRKIVSISSSSKHDTSEKISYQLRMARAVREFNKPIQIILSENDFTAKEFVETVNSSGDWDGIFDLGNVSRIEIGNADHTFSSAEWRKAVESCFIAWLQRQVW